MLMLGLNETIYQLAILNSVHWHDNVVECVERGQSLFHKSIIV